MTAPKLPTRLRCCWPECHYEWDTPLTAHDYELCPRCYSSFTINKPYTLRAAMRAATAGSGAASAASAGSAAHVAPPVSASFEAALAALDVEPTHHPDRMVTTYAILGLDDVRAAHAEAVRVAVEKERAECEKACERFASRYFDASILHGSAEGTRINAAAAEAATNIAATIRARGVAKPRTDGEAATRSGEGAKS